MLKIPANSRWAPIARYPITELIIKQIKPLATKKSHSQGTLVSEELCVDSLKRISPYIPQDAPLDIVDLWPGNGVWSSAVNEYLRPRRHIMIEPELDVYGPFLKPLAKSKPSYTLGSLNIYTARWPEIFKKYLPEQKAPQPNESGDLPKNNSLLILANPPIPNSAKDHFTPSRWWAAVMESCMLQTGLHCYGSVRILASFPILEVQSVLPRTVCDRKRPALLTENVALHAFELASGYELEPWHSLKTWTSIQSNMHRVTERAAAQDLTTPAGREAIPLELAPDSPKPQKGIPYHPRARTEGHDSFMEAIEKGARITENSHKYKAQKVSEAKKDATRALASLKFDNRTALVRENLTRDQMVIDKLMAELCHAAADPKMTTEKLQALDKKIGDTKAALQEEIDSHHFRLHRSWDRNLDDARIETHSNNLDESVLLWDRRPFHPLHIKPDEVFPLGTRRTFVYFEPAEKPPATALSKIPIEKREKLVQLFEALSVSFGTRHQMTIAELTDSLFPGRTTEEILKMLPSLVKYTGKRLKPNCGPVSLPEGDSNPEKCFQENIEYDLTEYRLRCVPVSVLWDILLEYQKHALDLSSLEFSRLLGGTLTSFRAGDYSIYQAKRLH
ncbi:uncharacterized protein N7483_007223 [Penicillium malachiteum]|uniref:uncharacterized protein n=1 Tax=Penicillium malachiteum TaxID=1324776 RepID=UPI002547FDDF|nr:uncharacterized protein N7483_007223 [Penicillium malachiteum]KAJ5725866.1 hypothetical protein N7483_007223 [Penicillium malachiteum]